MKKKIISLAAILVLASMMLVMFTGCGIISYKPTRACEFTYIDKSQLTVVLYKEIYSLKDGFAVKLFCNGNEMGQTVTCTKADLENGIEIKGIENASVNITIRELKVGIANILLNPICDIKIVLKGESKPISFTKIMNSEVSSFDKLYIPIGEVSYRHGY